MNAEQYFAIALPTDEDFATWTKSLFARAERANRRIAKRYPDLDERKGELPIGD